MARQYVANDDEMRELITSLEIPKLRELADPSASAERKRIADEIHRHFHMVVLSWANRMGYDRYPR